MQQCGNAARDRQTCRRPSVARAAPAYTALAIGDCRQSPHLRPVPAATKPASLIMTSFATEAGPWALGTPSVTDVTDALPRLNIRLLCTKQAGDQPWRSAGQLVSEQQQQKRATAADTACRWRRSVTRNQSDRRSTTSSSAVMTTMSAMVLDCLCAADDRDNILQPAST